MMYPILCNVRYETLHHILGQKALWKQVLFSVVFNWIIAPFFMVCYSGAAPVNIANDVARTGMGLSS